MQRVMTDVMDYGTDMMWLSSISIGIPDSNPLQGAGAICSTFPKLQLREGEGFPDGVCLWDIEGDPDQRDHQDDQSTRLSSGQHAHLWRPRPPDGDRHAGEAKKERPLQPLTALDHSQLFNPNVIKRSGELGMIWSLNPGMFAGAQERGGRGDLR